MQMRSDLCFFSFLRLKKKEMEFIMSTMKSKQSGVGVLKILIIEDDAKTADFIEKGFQEAGF